MLRTLLYSTCSWWASCELKWSRKRAQIKADFHLWWARAPWLAHSKSVSAAQGSQRVLVWLLNSCNVWEHGVVKSSTEPLVWRWHAGEEALKAPLLRGSLLILQEFAREPDPALRRAACFSHPISSARPSIRPSVRRNENKSRRAL